MAKIITSKDLFVTYTERNHLRAIFSGLGDISTELYNELFEHRTDIRGMKSVIDRPRDEKYLSILQELAPPRLYDMILKMLSHNPSDRPSAFDLMNDMYFDGVADIIEESLPAKLPGLSLDCISKLDARSVCLKHVILDDEDDYIESRIDLIKIADYIMLDTISLDTISLALYLMDVFNTIDTSTSNTIKYLVSLKIASNIYGPNMDLTLSDLIEDQSGGIMKSTTDYEHRVLRVILQDLSATTSYMYMIEYATKLDIKTPVRGSVAIKVLNLLSLSDLRFTLDPSTLGISALYVAAKIEGNIPDRLLEEVELIDDEVELAYDFYINHKDDDKYKRLF